METYPSDLPPIRLFKTLSAAAVQSLYSAGRMVHVSGRQVILQEGEAGSPVYFVLEGSVRVYRTNLEGREQTIITLQPGDAFNLPAAFMASREAAASAATEGPARLLAIPLDEFRAIASSTPDVALAVMEDLSTRLNHFTALTHDLSLRSVRGRVARFLLAQYNDESQSPGHWTQEGIAAQVGSVREVVSRTLRAFVNEGLIKMDRQQILLLDVAALEREVDEGR